MFKIIQTETQLSENGQTTKEIVMVDSFSSLTNAKQKLDELRKTKKNGGYVSDLENGVEFSYGRTGYESGEQKEWRGSIAIVECRTVKNGEDEIDVSSLQYDYIDDFYYDRAVVRKGEKYGIINLEFELVLSFVDYDKIEPYSKIYDEPFAKVIYDNDGLLVDLSGNFIVKVGRIFHRIPSSDIFWAYKSNSRTRWVKIKLYPDFYRGPDDDSEEFTFYDVERGVFMDYGDYSRPDAKDDVFAIGGFEGDVARIRVGDKCGLIDENEKIIIEPKYDELCQYSNGLSAFKTCEEFQFVRNNRRFERVVTKPSKWGYVDKRGNEVIPAQFDFAGSFYAGHAAICVGGRYVYELSDNYHEDPSASFYDELYYPELSNIYPEEYTRVFKGGKWGFIDKTGNLVTPLEYDRISPFYNCGVAIVERGGYFGLISADLKEETGCKYSSIEYDSYPDSLEPPTFSAINFYPNCLNEIDEMFSIIYIDGKFKII